MIDWGSELGRRAARRLREEPVLWLTTVSPAGAPLPMPVWFVWDGAEELLVYSIRGARTRNLHSNPKVALNFDGNGQGGDIVVLSGIAEVAAGAPPADANPAYLDKYAGRIARMGTQREFAERYSVALRITLARLRGH